MERVLRVLRLKHVPIFQQLCIEEALFYNTSSNWLLLNEGHPEAKPTVVLGISGKPEKMCNLELVRRDKVPLIKRFSGGGTVIVDRSTMFASLIVNQADVPECKPFPREIMDWSTGIYGPAFRSVATKSDVQLGLRENDYVFGDLKFGGNAQAITKGRWLHHTSFLWDFDPTNMLYLQMPEKRPQYRGDRDHTAFLTPLQDHVERQEGLWPALKTAAGEQFVLEEASIYDVPGVSGASASGVEENNQGEISSGSSSSSSSKRWMEACRTKFVGLDGKPLPPPAGGHVAPLA
ncbi:unnamed protein product [Pylaiella littoralis]